MGSEAREVLADFMNQGHLTYRVAGRVSDYDCADAMIRDLAAAGVVIVSRAELESLRASLRRVEEERDEAREVRDTMIAWAIELLATDPECGSHAAAGELVKQIIAKNRLELRRIRAEKAERLSRPTSAEGE